MTRLLTWPLRAGLYLTLAPVAVVLDVLDPIQEDETHG